jgi:serine/threonine protein kinase
MQAEDALLHLEELRILHRDIKPSNFLTHTLHRRVRLLLSDFDLACEEDEAEESSTPVGTAAFWSPWFDMNNPDWTYTRDDDWLGLGLTFGYWLGVYSGSPLPKAAAEQKLRVLSKMLGPAWEEHLPDSFRDRFRPLYAQLRAFHQQQVEVQQE